MVGLSKLGIIRPRANLDVIMRADNKNTGFRTTTDTRLAKISTGTLRHYDDRSEQFWQGTRDHDVSQNIDALIGAIDAVAPLRILDLGCGPGRDLHALKARGHAAIGLDGCLEFCQMARDYANVEVWHQNFLALDLPADSFDGVFANASLFHVPTSELPRVLLELRDCLCPGGVLFSSNPRGENEEGWNRGRYGSFHDFANWRDFVLAAGFRELDHYYRPAGKSREEQGWLASTWRRPLETHS